MKFSEDGVCTVFIINFRCVCFWVSLYVATTLSQLQGEVTFLCSWQYIHDFPLPLTAEVSSPSALESLYV